MSKSHIPCFYMPTQVVFVDDSEHFLTKVVLQISSASPYVTFADTSKALDYINKDDAFIGLINDIVKPNLESIKYGVNPQEHETQVLLEPIYNQVNNPHRFDPPTIVIVDYAMPDINGIEFCRKIKNPNIKKVLLTGQADEALAVDAFNEGVIDKFISKKQTKNSGELIDSAIETLQKAYFCELTSPIKSTLSSLSGSCLYHQDFEKIFEEIVNKNEIVEYYLLSTSGSFLLVDAKGKRSWFVVASQSEIDDYCSVAEDHKVPSAFIKMMRTGKKIPFFSSVNEYMNSEGSQWEAYLHDANKSSEESGFYYTLVSDQDLMFVDETRFISLHTYLNDYWPPI